jgi:hypothetical protein
MVTPAAVIQLDTRFDPGRHWNRSHVAALPDHIGEYPMPFALLEAFHGQRGYLCPSETASSRTATIA